MALMIRLFKSDLDTSCYTIFAIGKVKYVVLKQKALENDFVREVCRVTHASGTNTGENAGIPQPYE